MIGTHVRGHGRFRASSLVCLFLLLLVAVTAPGCANCCGSCGGCGLFKSSAPPPEAALGDADAVGEQSVLAATGQGMANVATAPIRLVGNGTRRVAEGTRNVLDPTRWPDGNKTQKRKSEPGLLASMFAEREPEPMTPAQWIAQERPSM
jgi:hypothetical protein